jgi:CDP-diacylglycerol--serine O-phosphatidyltransferase
MNYRRIVPNSISSISLIFGVLSIFKTFEHDFFYAAVFVILAVLADSMDGRAARLLGVSGDFGKELDSLCDLGSFGVAPAIMIYHYGMTELGLAGQIIAAFFTIGGAMRLARFNVNAATVKGYFQGMPIPAGACCLATYVLSGYTFSPMMVAVMTFVIAVIMYSNVKFPDFKGKGNPMFAAPVVVALVIGAYMIYERPAAWPFILMFTYTVAGIINYFYVLVLRK